jgi:hypothetical protein
MKLRPGEARAVAPGRPDAPVIGASYPFDRQIHGACTHVSGHILGRLNPLKVSEFGGTVCSGLQKANSPLLIRVMLARC